MCGHAKDTIDLAMQVAVASQESAEHTKKGFPFAETVQNTGKLKPIELIDYIGGKWKRVPQVEKNGHVSELNWNSPVGPNTYFYLTVYSFPMHAAQQLHGS